MTILKNQTKQNKIDEKCKTKNKDRLQDIEKT